MSNEEQQASDGEQAPEEPPAAESPDGAEKSTGDEVEETPVDEEEEPSEGHIEGLEAELTERKERIADLESRLKRTQADFQNYKKRAKKRQKQVEKRATEDLVERLLDVRDNLSRAVEEESEDTESLQEGVEMTLSEFDRVLEGEDVSTVSPEPGTEVDPQRHEVMMRVESDQPEGAIDEVYTPGYEMAEKVLRPAQVTVSDGTEE